MSKARFLVVLRYEIPILLDHPPEDPETWSGPDFDAMIAHRPHLYYRGAEVMSIDSDKESRP